MTAGNRKRRKGKCVRRRIGVRWVLAARALLTCLLAASLSATPVYANYCALPGKDGTASLSGVINTYYPGTANESVGSTSINVGSPRGSSARIAAGDLLLIIQMQDASINTNNDSRYGNGTNGGYGQGYSAINQTGVYEFVRANGSVSGGTVSVTGATGGGIVNAYYNQNYSGSNRRRSFQVIRVPQYVDATISGLVTAERWNGSTGGIVAIDVAGRLTFAGGTISVEGRGFRGGGGRQLSGDSGGSDSNYRSSASSDYHGSKGEGISGTPRYVNDGGTLLDTGSEGYPSGSHARGAPGNAGGGGSDGNPEANDENSGGGGGNGGDGGTGGYAWCNAGPPNCDQTGGHPGDNVSQAGVSRLVMGGGGGAGTSNNGTGSPGSGFASSGAAGGGIVMLRAGEIAGSGMIDADGADANSTVANDGSGGGGAGGSVLVSSLRSVAGASLTISANGGEGGSNNSGTSDAHGPGGGGGGGVVLRTATVSTSVSVQGGFPGTTLGGGSQGANYGATAGSSGISSTVSASSIPGTSSGGECTPTITKSFATSPIMPGSPSRMSIAIRNNNPNTSMTNVGFNDAYPSGLVNTSTPATANSCGSGSLTATANGTSFRLNNNGTIAAGATCTYSVNTTVTSFGERTNTLDAGAIGWRYGGTAYSSLTPVSAILSASPPLTIMKSSQVYYDPVNGTSNPYMIPGSIMAYTVTVANPGALSVDTDSIIVIDATPANLMLRVANIPGGSGPVLFQDGSPASGLTYNFSSLGSSSDDVDFSSNGGATWNYVPTPNASGMDPNVTHIRIRPKGTMAAGSSFDLIFAYAVQ